MNLRVLLFVCLTSFLQAAPDAGSTEAVTLLESKPSSWPAFATLTKDFAAEYNGQEVVVKAGTRAVLLRIEQGRALLDTGRKGSHFIPIEFTDLLEETARPKVGDDAKQAANFVVMFANKIVLPGSRESIAYEDLQGTRAFALIYGDGSTTSNAQLARMDQLRSDWSAKLPGVVFVYLHTTESPELFTGAVDSLKHLPFFPFQFARGYKKALKYSVGSPTGCVLIGSDGQTLLNPFEIMSDDDIDSLMEQMQKALNRVISAPSPTEPAKK
ncbi:MAG: hypothetical protein SFY80_02070 [Verrucomicrobiota bacterium]|nr:hypothetical protein [Verrucomicrobiota bacterium]